METETWDERRERERREAGQRKQNPKLNDFGYEVLDPTPMEPPLNYKQQPSLHEQIRDMIRSERLRQEVMAQGYETFEEADDFHMDEDPEPWAPYEEQFEPTPMQELHRRRRQATEDAQAAASSSAPEPKTGATVSTSAVDDPAPPQGAGSSGGAQRSTRTTSVPDPK